MQDRHFDGLSDKLLTRTKCSSKGWLGSSPRSLALATLDQAKQDFFMSMCFKSTSWVTSSEEGCPPQVFWASLTCLSKVCWVYSIYMWSSTLEKAKHTATVPKEKARTIISWHQVLHLAQVSQFYPLTGHIRRSCHPGLLNRSSKSPAKAALDALGITGSCATHHCDIFSLSHFKKHSRRRPICPNMCDLPTQRLKRLRRQHGCRDSEQKSMLGIASLLFP